LTAPAPGRETIWFHARVWFFKSFFPQLIAGPIVKANEFIHQIGAKRFADIEWDTAVKRLIAGFFLKMVVADNLKEATNAGLAYPNFLLLPKLNLLALLYGFSFQIFADFCGYSLIAMGLAKLFGYELPINFNFPYLSRSITEFWRRWHISLSTWLRLYLYIPLGGNRLGEARTYVNLFLVMFLGGLWHGAEWRFAVWGTAHGILLALERMLGVKAPAEAAPPPWNLGGIIRLLITFNLVSALWLLFKLPKFGYVLEYARCLITNPGGAQPQGIFVIILFSLPVIVHHAFQALPGAADRLRARLGELAVSRAEAALYGVLLFAILVNAGTPGEFIYFQF
jgi:alginate O-acetyltransferase complex protein AlgI